jgi:hypothetical protein
MILQSETNDYNSLKRSQMIMRYLFFQQVDFIKVLFKIINIM